jgi:UDP-N-acetylglucosamine 1-carboxyvinyltransferase
LLTDEVVRLSNLPHLTDISTMANLLVQHGVDFRLDGCDDNGGHFGEVITLQAEEITHFEAPYDIVRKMRASVLVLGPLLARYGKAKVSLPGGCAIGTRPIDLHLKALQAMGADITLEDGYISASVNGKLQGATIDFSHVSVGATENIVMAASIAEGTTVINNAAREPEVTDLVHCLISMGAKIEGVGTSTLTIEGVERLSGTDYSVIADRIEAGTYMIAAAITNGHLILQDVSLDLMVSTVEALEQAGVAVEEKSDGIHVYRRDGVLHPITVDTAPYPGFPTDMQAQFIALVSLAEGTSTVTENIFENRFMHVPELARMGADITVKDHQAIIHGSPSLKGAELMATDLRASVSLVVAALAAEGETIINRMYHIDRGYERVEEKLLGVGAQIERLR